MTGKVVCLRFVRTASPDPPWAAAVTDVAASAVDVEALAAAVPTADVAALVVVVEPSVAMVVAVDLVEVVVVVDSMELLRHRRTRSPTTLHPETTSARPSMFGM
jgi:hypothetical protein